MTTSDRDLSSYDGAPITLYTFTRASVPTLTPPVTTNWRYTSGDRDYVFGGNTYKALAISDDGVRQNGDTSSDQLTITMPNAAEIPLMFLGSPPSDPITAVIARTHEGESDLFYSWNGTVGGVTRKDDLTAQVLCNTTSATLDRTGLRLSYGRLCPHNLYGTECTADPANFFVTDTVIGLTGNALSGSALALVPNGRWVGGYIEWLDDAGHAERRGIIDHGGDTIVIMGATDGLVIGKTFFAFFGCAHNVDDCFIIFDNVANYGGHPYLPGISPFSGDVIF